MIMNQNLLDNLFFLLILIFITHYFQTFFVHKIGKSMSPPTLTQQNTSGMSKTNGDSKSNQNGSGVATVNYKPAVSHNVHNYIKELEISEVQLSSVLKNVYENEQKDEFMKRLEDRVKQYDVEIEKLCNLNYQSFVNTFNELLSVREDTVKLKGHFVQNNEKIQKVGSSLISKVDELVNETKKQNNILLSIEALNKYLPVFNIYRQLKYQMREKKNYYQALKLLEDLEINYLPMVKHYRFSQSIHQSIPIFKEEIKSETIADLKNFLESVRVLSEQVGKIANQQMAERLKIDQKYFLLDSELANRTAENNLNIVSLSVFV